MRYLPSLYHLSRCTKQVILFVLSAKHIDGMIPNMCHRACICMDTCAISSSITQTKTQNLHLERKRPMPLQGHGYQSFIIRILRSLSPLLCPVHFLHSSMCNTLCMRACVSLWIHVLTPIISILLWTPAACMRCAPLFLSPHTCSLWPDLWLTDHILNIRRDTCASKAVFSLSRFCFIPHLLFLCLPVVTPFSSIVYCTCVLVHVWVCERSPAAAPRLSLKCYLANQLDGGNSRWALSSI